MRLTISCPRARANSTGRTRRLCTARQSIASCETGVDTENPVRIENAGIRSVREIIIVSTMTPFFIALLALVNSTFRTRAAQQVEIVALRHQIAGLQQSAPRRLRLRQSDRLLWIWLSRCWPAALAAHPQARHSGPLASNGVCALLDLEIAPPSGKARSRCCDCDLIQQMSQANFLWGAPRIHGELLKLGIEIAPSTVGKYLRRPGVHLRRPGGPS